MGIGTTIQIGPAPSTVELKVVGSEPRVPEPGVEKKVLEQTNSQGAALPYRACPLSTKNIICLAVFLGIFSYIYLFPAQQNRILFYTMTSIIALIVGFIYTVGFLCVMFMVTDPYSGEIMKTLQQTSESTTSFGLSSKDQEEAEDTV